MIHRGLRDYIQPFYDHGFILGALDEPEILSEVCQKYADAKKSSLLPKRLNLLFAKRS